jgi:hypothetical protein
LSIRLGRVRKVSRIENKEVIQHGKSEPKQNGKALCERDRMRSQSKAGQSKVEGFQKMADSLYMGF